MKGKCKKGDRIRLYGMAWGMDGVGAAYVADPLVIVKTAIDWVMGSETVVVWEAKNPISGTRYLVHPKQCRKLKKRHHKKCWSTPMGWSCVRACPTYAKGAQERKLRKVKRQD